MLRKNALSAMEPDMLMVVELVKVAGDRVMCSLLSLQ
jgi:hypothetical protein